MADAYLEAYKLRHPQSATFAEYAVAHVKRIVGSKMFVDCNEATVTSYQNARLQEGAAPKTVNEEVGFLLRILDELGDILRVRLRKRKLLKLKVGKSIGKAYTEEEKLRMLEEAKSARSPHIYPAIMLALNAGIRDAELKQLTWEQINLKRGYLTVGKSKTEAGEGRTIPLNSALAETMSDYAEWYRGVSIRSSHSGMSSLSASLDQAIPQGRSRPSRRPGTMCGRKPRSRVVGMIIATP
jgi:integrase